MDDIDILKNFIENNNGVITLNDLIKLNLNKHHIKILHDEKYITRVANGVYVKNNQTINNYFLLQQRYKTAFFSHTTALYLHNLIKTAPQKLDLTFTTNVRLKKGSIHPHYLIKEHFNIGQSELTMKDGATIKIYDLERTIIDILRDRNKLDAKLVNTALTKYLKRNDKDLVKLLEYAKIFRLENVLKEYISL